MAKLKNYIFEHKTLLLILVLAACARLIRLGSLPDGVTPDEAYNAYNTWSLMTAGIDSRGYHHPVYFVAWGSGMNALYAYLALPLFHLFGAGIAVFRLPQALVSLGSVFALYILGRELFDRKMGYLMAFALAINPWSIQTGRFGLESTLAPGMILFSLTFLVLGLKKNPNYLLASALFMGASLYSYSLTWIVLPLILLLTLLFYRKLIPHRPVTWISAGLLVMAAIPLLLFLLINLGFMPEISTPFFSIPRLIAFRGGEFSLGHFFDNVTAFLNIILHQHDSESHSSVALMGAYYKFTTPFFLLGVIIHFVNMVKSRRRGENDLQYIFLIWLACAVIMAMTLERMTMTHLNLVHIPMIFYSVYGIAQTAQYVKSRLLVPACVMFFSISFIWFVCDYRLQTSTAIYNDTAAEALETAKNMAAPDQAITIVGYPTIQSGVWMWFEKPDPSDFHTTVTYIDDPAWGQIGSYRQFRYVYSLDQITGEDVYILFNNAENLKRLTAYDLTVVSLNERYLIACPDASQ